MDDVPAGKTCPQARFMARVTADATHEVRNVLAIVNESAGLVGDLVAAAGPERAPDHDRVRSALARIEAQVARGADLMTSLNRLAHGLDRQEEDVDLVDALRHVIRLFLRFTRERRRSVQLPETQETVTVRANLLEVYMALAEALERQLEELPEGGALVVTVEPRGEGAAIRFGERAPAPLSLP